MTENKVSVTMTATGRVMQYPPGTNIREILEEIHQMHQRAGSDWDRPTKLFVAGECIVAAKLTDIAWEYGEYRRRQEDMVEGLLDEWVSKRFGGGPESEAA